MTGHVYKKKPSDEDERVIMRDGDASSSATSESDHAEARKQHRNGRQILLAFVTSLKFQVAVVVVTVICALLVIAELLIDLRIFGLDAATEPQVATGLYCAYVALLGLMAVENVAKLILMGLSFFQQKAEMFDFVIVILSFSLVVGLAGKDKFADGPYGLLVMLRLWRVTRILSSIVNSVKEEAERKMTKERRAKRALEREVMKLRDYCFQQECELDALRLCLRTHGIPEPPILRLPHTPQTLRVIAEINEFEDRMNELNISQLNEIKTVGHSQV